jgi:hypothetical protein
MMESNDEAVNKSSTLKVSRCVEPWQTCCSSTASASINLDKQRR